MGDAGASEEGGARYFYRPSLLGAPREFVLNGSGIEWSVGRHSGHVAYTAVRRVRLSYRPANLQTYRFVTEVWAQGAPKLTVVSTSWKGMTVQERLDAPYVAFVTALHQRIARAGAAVLWEKGTSPLTYWPGLAAFVIVALALAALIARAFQVRGFTAAIFIAAFLAVFLWQGGNFFRRNRPGIYRPDALPPDLVPKT